MDPALPARTPLAQRLRLPVVRRARVTPSGLRPITRPRDNPADFPTMIPWDRIDLIGSGGAHPTDAGPDGSPIRINGRRLGLSLSDTRATALARIAQRRALGRAWENGTLSITRAFEPPKTWELLVPLAFAAAMIAAGVPMLITAWRNISPYPPNLAPLAILTLVVASVTWLFMPALVIWMLLQTRRLNVLRITLDTQGITAQLTDGRRERRPWRALRGCTRATAGRTLTFDDGLELRLRCSGRTAIVLGLWSAGTDTAAESKERGARRRQLVRVCIVWLVGGLLFAVVVGYINTLGLGPGQGLSPLWAFLIVGFGLPAISVGGTVVTETLQARTKPLFRRRTRGRRGRPLTPPG